MLGILLVLILILIAAILIGIFSENRMIRLIAWCMSGFCMVGTVFFLLYMLPRLLKR